MKISSITDIVEGELLNTPSISFVYHIKTNPRRVNEGDLFIAKNSKDLQLAIDNGAFGVVYDFETSISDKEIAWIKVDSYSNALVRLFRFHLSHFDLNVFYCDDVTFELLQIYKSLNKNLKFLTSNLEDSVKILENIEANDILVSTNKEVLDKIYPNNVNFKEDDHRIENLTSHSLFETSFSYDGAYFFKVKTSELYLQQFLDVYNFYNQELDFSKIKNFSCFKPVFVDRFINVIDFGKSDKFLIPQKNKSLVDDEIAYIKKRYKYARTIFITTEYIDSLGKDQYIVSSLKNLKEVLKAQKFNCAYIVGFDFTKVESALVKSMHEMTLL